MGTARDTAVFVSSTATSTTPSLSQGIASPRTNDKRRNQKEDGDGNGTIIAQQLLPRFEINHNGICVEVSSSSSASPVERQTNIKASVAVDENNTERSTVTKADSLSTTILQRFKKKKKKSSLVSSNNDNGVVVDPSSEAASLVPGASQQQQQRQEHPQRPEERRREVQRQSTWFGEPPRMMAIS